MKLLYLLGLGGLSLATTIVFAQGSWVQVSRSSTQVWEARAGSFEYSLTESTREPIVAMVVRVRDINGGRVEFERNYVRLSHCRAGFGKLVATDLNGRAKYDNDFILDGGNVASSIAETLCALARTNPATQPSDMTPGRF